jgi:cell wall-associated NlpC family hydrolase
MAIAAPAALAGSAGGVAAGPSATAAPKTPAPKPRLHLAPVTARSQSLSYRGPVFERTATGELVPYQPLLATAPPATPTGGSPVAVTSGGASPAGVTAPAKPQLVVPGSLARYVGGLAAAPMSAPPAVQQAIWTANQIIGLRYVYGGGHASFVASGYDCSGTVSFALHGGGLLTTPMDSSELMAWGSRGLGRWITVFSNPGHAYVDIAGLRLDTSAADDPSNQQGPRWRPLRAANGGYTVRHPLGF